MSRYARHARTSASGLTTQCHNHRRGSYLSVDAAKNPAEATYPEPILRR